MTQFGGTGSRHPAFVGSCPIEGRPPGWFIQLLSAPPWGRDTPIEFREVRGLKEDGEDKKSL